MNLRLGLLLTRTDGVLTIVLNRPERRNAVDRLLADELSSALDMLEDDPALRVGILAANGPVFCAGTDLHELVSPSTERGGEYGLVRRYRRKPLIAALKGLPPAADSRSFSRVTSWSPAAGPPSPCRR